MSDTTSRWWDRIRSRFSRGLLLAHPVWSWLVVVECLWRASSYWYRPPVIITPTSARIEGVVPYPVWATLLLLAAVLITAGVLRPWPVAAWVGHLVGVLITATLAASILSSAVFDGQPWSGFAPLVIVGIIHLGRANAFGSAARDRIVSRPRVGLGSE